MPASASAPRTAERAERLSAAMRERELDALLVSERLNVRYMTGFTGSAGVAIFLTAGDEAAGAAAHRFLTDFRYATQSAEQIPAHVRREIVTGSLFEAAAAKLEGEGGRLGFDDANVSVRDHARLQERLSEGWQLVPCTGMIERLRLVKDAGELAQIRAAAELADEAMSGLLEGRIVGRTEREVALELENRMRDLGAEPSFPTIVAAGTRGALPHAEAGAAEIAPDLLLTIDWGARLEGYCSDCTRTYATGAGVSAQAREIYELVRTAQEQGVQAVAAGPRGREVDAVARAVIEGAGHGEHFGHGLGHGVGMDVHEAPRLSRTDGEEPLRAGSVVTVEPGVYLPDCLGVRIEDLVVVGEQDREVLTHLPKELTVIS
ncbi:MAG: aminopeptidase P family protein [Actinobacteria bacterium]|nr:MAG: aminopeptidase P family protein [Actinomycetota bacterium]